MARQDSVPEMTEAIFARLITQWDTWKNRDAASNNPVIADDFQAISAHGLLRTGKPTARGSRPITFTACSVSRSRIFLRMAPPVVGSVWNALGGDAVQGLMFF
jgi:hypothetical protein